MNSGYDGRSAQYENFLDNQENSSEAVRKINKNPYLTATLNDSGSVDIVLDEQRLKDLSAKKFKTQYDKILKLLGSVSLGPDSNIANINSRLGGIKWDQENSLLKKSFRQK